MPSCTENITREGRYDYIIENRPEYYESINMNPNLCVQMADNRWLIVHSVLPYSDLNLSALGYSTIPKLYEVMDTSSIEATKATAVTDMPYLNARGQEVLIGIIDTGIDYLKENFMDSGGNTRIEAIWDQSADYYDSEQPVLYGRVYNREIINEAIRAKRNGGNPYDIVSSRDESGHGTFLAGVAASSKLKDYTGVAPESDLVIVKLKGAKQYLKDYYLVKDDAMVFQENDIMMGVRFISDYADSHNKPLVLLLGLGTWLGSRTGNSPLADMLETLTKKKNTAVVVPVGNAAVDKTHFSGYAGAEDEYKEIEVNVTQRGKGFTMEVWARSLDVLSVSIISPTGEEIPRVPARLGVSNEFYFLLEDTTVTVDYQVTEAVSGLEVVFIRFISPAEGIWRVRLYSLTNLPGFFNSYLTSRNVCDTEIYFLNSDPDTTLTEPSCATRVISIGAYNHLTGGSDVNSSRGYTADDKIKPEMVAPGVNVYGVGGVAGYTRMSGTSVAAAHVAGACALFLSWGVTNNRQSLIGNSEIKAYLIRGADRRPNMEYPNRIYGYGTLNIANAFDQMRIS
ncbi:MAG: S8 family peptidase [Eubacteriales bacterium]|nr:S8 family peptidase [Eubacteriales bacterium]